MLLETLLLMAAGFVGGALNAVAGGGSFFTLAALVWVGVPPVAANATGTLALLPGYVASAWRFRQDIVWPASLPRWQIVLCVLLGGAAGSAILLSTDQRYFASLVPWLIFFASGLFVLGPRLQRYFGPLRSASLGLGVLFVVSVYGGYFNGGLGVVLLAALALLGQTHLPGMNGLKNLISAMLTLIAVVIYILGGAIQWSSLWLMMLAAIVGGYCGAVWSYRVPESTLRALIVGSGLVIGLVFLWQQY